MTAPPFQDPAVEKVFKAYPKSLGGSLLKLRALIFEAAERTDVVGSLVETLKWGQPAYLPAKPRIGTTLRVGPLDEAAGTYALFVPCQTDLIEQFREAYGDAFAYRGKRSLEFSTKTRPDQEALRHCIAMALTYHLKKRGT